MSGTRLYLVRHGVTASNVAHRYMGRSEETLTSDGRWQARQLALRLAPVDLAAIYSSPLRRTRETAAILARPHALQVEVAPEFNELDLQRWAGMTGPEIAARDPEVWEQWCADPFRVRLPGIEAFDELRMRVRRGLETLVRRHPDTAVAVITHDGIVRITVLEGLGIDPAVYRSIPVENTGLTILDVQPERTYLRALNDTGHLDEPVHAALAGPAER